MIVVHSYYGVPDAPDDREYQWLPQTGTHLVTLIFEHCQPYLHHHVNLEVPVGSAALFRVVPDNTENLRMCFQYPHHSKLTHSIILVGAPADVFRYCILQTNPPSRVDELLPHDRRIRFENHWITVTEQEGNGTSLSPTPYEIITMYFSFRLANQSERDREVRHNIRELFKRTNLDDADDYIDIWTIRDFNRGWVNFKSSISFIPPGIERASELQIEFRLEFPEESRERRGNLQGVGGLRRGFLTARSSLGVRVLRRQDGNGSRGANDAYLQLRK